MSNKPIEDLFVNDDCLPTLLSHEELRGQVVADMRKNSLTPIGLLTVDGKLHYFTDKADGKKRDKGWYVIHSGKYSRAHYGHFVQGKHHSWYASSGRMLPVDELSDTFAEVKRVRCKTARKRAKKAVVASKKALSIWATAKPADPNHVYLQSHGVAAHDLRQFSDTLLVPLRRIGGTVESIQKLQANGKKFYEQGTVLEGLHYVIGDIGDIIYICEGVATALTIYSAMGGCVVAALSCNQLQAIAFAYRLAYPHMKITVAGDDDHLKKKNPGRKTATAVAKLVEGYLAFPKFASGETGTDFNDFAKLHSLADVKHLIDAAEPQCEWPPQITSTAAQTDSQLANANRFIAHFGCDFVFAGHKWLEWSPGWQGKPGRIKLAVAKLGAVIAQEASELIRQSTTAVDGVAAQMREESAKLLKWSRTSESHGSASGTTHYLEGLLGKDISMFDADAWVFSCKDGVIDLRTVEFRPRRRTDFTTKSAGCAFDQNADCPLWKSFIDAVCCGKDDLVDWLHRILGYLLIGNSVEQILLFFYGKGRNGKGTLLYVLQQVLGDYAFTAQPDLLIRPKSDKHLTEIADLDGMRLVVCTESNKGAKLNTSRVKALTGEDKITARRMHKNGKEFIPQQLLIMQTNFLPVIEESDKATWRRIRVVPFNARISKQEEDKHLREKLVAEASGILNWMLDGYRKYLWYGLLNEPEIVRIATKAYRLEHRSVETFVKQQYAASKNAETQSSELHRDFRMWAKKQHVSPDVTPQAFGQRLHQAGVESKHTSHGTFYCLKRKAE